ncbi:MAG: hypothetical protein ACON4H_16395 [Rubripirellula sp.]
MQGTHPKAAVWIQGVNALILFSCLAAFFSGSAYGQLSFTPNPAPNGTTGFSSGGTSSTPQTNLAPIQNGGISASPNTAGAFDPYAIASPGTVPPVGSPNPTFGSPQTLPNGGLTTPGLGTAGMGGAGNGATAFPGTNPSGANAGAMGQAGTGMGTYGNSAISPNNGNMNNAALNNRGGLFGLFSLPASSTAAYGTGNTLDNPSVYGPAGTATPPSLNAGTGYGPNPYPNSIYPQNSPNSLFPDGFGSAYSGGLLQNPSTSYNDSRRLQGARFRYTYVSPGSKPAHLGMNDLDASLAFAFPNFLNLNQPLYLIPSFSLRLWDGPDGVATTSDLPAKAFDAFVDVGWESDPNKMVSTDFGLRLGVFTDFDTYTDRSFRVRGRALVNFRLTPVTSFKGGVYYVNRDELKLIPAAGLLYRPDPYTRVDLYFPKPKYARYYRTLGTYDLWWYVTGDYGGGSWTVTRDSGPEDSVDINDLRAILGIEWGPSTALAAGRRSGFLEIGYVFNREVLYRTVPADNFDPDDAFMFRVGIGY